MTWAARAVLLLKQSGYYLSVQLNPTEDVMAIRTADAEWSGNLAQGSGHMRLGSGAFEGPHDFRSRMGDGRGTHPEDLLGAAHAGCFSMALAL